MVFPFWIQAPKVVFSGFPQISVQKFSRQFERHFQSLQALRPGPDHDKLAQLDPPPPPDPLPGLDLVMVIKLAFLKPKHRGFCIVCEA